MKKRIMTITCLAMLFSVSSGLAAPSLEQLRDLYPDVEGESWSYTTTVDDDEGHRVERYQQGVWQLISYKGGEPDDKARKRYADYLSDEEAQEERNDPVYFTARLLRELSELNVVEETDAQVIYGFPASDVGDAGQDEINQHLQARIIFDVAENLITMIRVNNTKTVSPMPMAKISKLSVEMTLSDGRNGIPKGFLVKTNEIVKGRFMGVKKFEQNDSSSFSQYARD